MAARTPLKIRIGELAARTGRSVHTIRWYEQQGLLPPVPRLPPITRSTIMMWRRRHSSSSSSISSNASARRNRS